MAGQVEGGRPLLQGKVFGFPTHLDLSFVVIMAILGYTSGFGYRDLAIWLLITPVAVLVHELGHAFTARATGARPEIALAGFGGVTSYLPPRELSRWRSLGISLAGPAVGLVIGAVLVGVQFAMGDSIVAGSWQDSALWIATFTSLGWSVLNLLPVLPLDGGQAMRELLPGSPAVRERRAAMVSVVVAVAAAAAAYLLAQQVFIALFLVFFAVSNVLTLRSGNPDPTGRGTVEQAVIELLWQGRPAEARQALANRPPDVRVDPVLHAAVQALTGEPQQGYAVLAQERQRRPDDVTVAAVSALTWALAHDWDALLAYRGTGAAVPESVLERAAVEALQAGRPEVAAALKAPTPAQD